MIRDRIMAVFNDLSEFMLQPSTYYGLEYITEFKV